jgi:hypothetical protein
VAYIQMNDLLGSMPGPLAIVEDGNVRGYAPGLGMSLGSTRYTDREGWRDLVQEGMGDLATGPGALGAVYGTLALASTGIGFYHGYARNNGSFGWGLWWALMGGIFPVITPAYAFAQGLGQPAPSV